MPAACGQAPPTDDVAVQELIRGERIGALKVRLSRELGPNRIMRERSALHKGGEGRASLLQVAAYAECIAAVRALVDTPGCDPNLWKGTNYPSPLQCACMMKRLRAGGADTAAEISAQDPTQEATGASRTDSSRVSFGNVAIAELLLRRGAKVDEGAESCVAALALAVVNNNGPLCSLLLQHGADPCQNTRLNLWYIASNRGVDVWRLLCASAHGGMNRGDALRAAARGCIVEATGDPPRPDAGATMLHVVCDAAAHHPGYCLPSPCGSETEDLQLALAEDLLALGAAPTARDAKGRTPLHLAWSTSASPRLCRLLLKCGADPTARDLSWTRPLDGHPSGRSALHMCLAAEDRLTPQERREWCELLLDVRACDVAAASPQCGSTALHLLCRHAKRTAGAPEVANKLLLCGAPTDALDAALETPLYVACVAARSPALAATLLSHGADPDVPCRHQRTPLQALVRGEPFDGVGAIACLLSRHSRLPAHETPLSPTAASGPRLTDSPIIHNPLWHPFPLRVQAEQQRKAQDAGDRFPRRGGFSAAKARRARERDHFIAYLAGRTATCAMPLYPSLEDDRQESVGAVAAGGDADGAADDAVEAAARAAARRRWLETDQQLCAELSVDRRDNGELLSPATAVNGTDPITSEGRRAQLSQVPAAAVLDGGFARVRQTQTLPPSQAEWEGETADWQRDPRPRKPEGSSTSGSGLSSASPGGGSTQAGSRPASAPVRPAAPPQSVAAMPPRPPAVPVAGWQELPQTARGLFGAGDDVLTRMLRRREQDSRRRARAAAGSERSQRAKGERRTAAELMAARRQLLLDMVTHAGRADVASLKADQVVQAKRRDARRAELCRRRLAALTAVEAADGAGWVGVDACAADCETNAVPPRRAGSASLLPSRFSPTRA
eukprot:TRINITY_DN32747_c0_g1_i1.p1 TRINITY_DN32747_c0_g1~~TRINITY_DN32747_c0_g1_i1.p1  ORF type:complete len:918 (+),score=296.49 TRINITY_DN32747_c0_g1_i1:49-2754(+)